MSLQDSAAVKRQKARLPFSAQVHMTQVQKVKWQGQRNDTKHFSESRVNLRAMQTIESSAFPIVWDSLMPLKLGSITQPYSRQILEEAVSYVLCILKVCRRHRVLEHVAIASN